jgi:peroxiredoxin
MLSVRRQAQLGLLLACIVVVSSLCVLAAGARQAQVRGPVYMPAFKLADTDGKSVASAQFKSAATVYYFYSTRCSTCNDLAAQLHDWTRQLDSRAKIVGVHTRFKGPTAPAAEVRVQNAVAGLTFPTLMDDDAKLATQLGVDRTPTLVVVDAKGVIRSRKTLAAEGTADKLFAAMSETIQSMLQPATPPVTTPIVTAAKPKLVLADKVVR